MFTKQCFVMLLLTAPCLSRHHQRPRGSREYRESGEEEDLRYSPPPPPPHRHHGHPPPPPQDYESGFGRPEMHRRPPFGGDGFQPEADISRSTFGSQPTDETSYNEIDHGRRNNRGQRICERKYTEYIRSIFPGEEDTAADASDSEFDGRVLAYPGEYPHMAALGFETEDPDTGVDYKCGGSLISENFIITAAHCTNFTGLSPTTVRIGDLNLKVEETNVEPQIRNVKRIHNHPQYTASSYYNDIALLELDRDVSFTEFVRPIRLWVRPEIPSAIAYAMGYGSTAFGKARTNRLTDLNMTIVPNSECNSQMPAMPETANGIVTSQICAKDFKLNRDTCQGDSGGPLQLNLPGRRRRNRRHYHLIGITSYGLICRSGYPSVYTRVSSFLDWIEKIVWHTEY